MVTLILNSNQAKKDSQKDTQAYIIKRPEYAKLKFILFQFKNYYKINLYKKKVFNNEFTMNNTA